MWWTRIGVILAAGFVAAAVIALLVLAIVDPH
jgi:hypothetical protein